MKNNFLVFVCLAIFIVGCSSQSNVKYTGGEVVSNPDPETFHAEYKGALLKPGDRVNIFKYESMALELKNHQSRILPLKQKKILIGKAAVSAKLKDNFYELKSESPLHIPEGAFIEKY